MKKYKILYDSELNNQSFNKERDILLLAKKY